MARSKLSSTRSTRPSSPKAAEAASWEGLELVRRVRDRLAGSGVRSAAPEAEAIVLAAGRMSRTELWAGLRRLDAGARRRAERLAERRARREPLQHLLGEAWLCGHRFNCGPGALVPRPETEVLVGAALDVLERHYPRGASVLDVGTGTGCVAACLTLARPDCTMTALDVCSRALGIARKNLKLHGLEKKIKTVKSDLFAARGLAGRRWDLIVSNPPYVPTAEIARLDPEVRRDPRLALDGGPRGLDVIGRLLAESAQRLTGGGWLVIEAGKGQARAIDRMAGSSGRWAGARWVRDLNGVERVAALRRI